MPALRMSLDCLLKNIGISHYSVLGASSAAATEGVATEESTGLRAELGAGALKQLKCWPL